MVFKIAIPLMSSNGHLNLELNIGELVFVLGPNGSGKSSLMHLCSKYYPQNSIRVKAHRVIAMQSGRAEITSKQKSDIVKDIQHFNTRPESRWNIDYMAQYPSIAMHSILQAENRYARQLSDAVERNDNAGRDKLRDKGSVLKRLNNILRLSNLHFSIAIEEQDEEIVAQRSSGVRHSISQLSDGERSAILLAFEVLSAPADSLILVDEPERHLHRSIIAPLLSELLLTRPDCAFVISTHDPQLPIDHAPSQVLLTRACRIGTDGVANGYDVDFLENTLCLDDSVKRTLLGERRGFC